jgi:hypothetical protein
MSALREAEAKEKSKGARRGPSNASLEYFHNPTPVTDNGKKRWEFKCRHCKWYLFTEGNDSDLTCLSNSVRRVERTVDGKTMKFEDETKCPKMNNLATHVAECKAKRKESGPGGDNDAGSTTSSFNLQKSAEFMAAYLKEGELNPAQVATQKGFLRLFAAWILDESLPWTTGEAPTLRLLFKYLKVGYTLPSDTTVRNQLAHIFAELHKKVVTEFTASSVSKKDRVPDAHHII